MNPRDAVSALVGSKIRVALLAVLVLGGAIGGGFAAGALGVPSVAAIDNTFGDVTNETTAIETDLVVSNPNPRDRARRRLGELHGLDERYPDGAGRPGGVRVGTGNSTLGLETQLRNEEIPPWWVSPRPQRRAHDSRHRCDRDLGPARTERGLLAEPRDPDGSARRLQLRRDATGERRQPADERSRPLRQRNGGRVGGVVESDAIEMAFTVYNPNIEPYVVTEIGYDITMNGVEMGSGQTDEGYSIPSYSTETVEFTTALQNRHLDDWWVTHLDEEVRGHQVTGLRIEFYAVIEFPTGEEATIPLDALTYEETIETEIFDEGNDVRNASESSEDGSDDGGDGDDGGETSDGTTNGGNTTDGGNETDDGNTTENGTDDGTENGTDDGDDGVLPL